MNIHQLSVRYNQEQDRILLSVNTTASEELQLWLTRRLTLKLWPVLNQLVIDQFAIPADAKSDGYVNLAALDAHTKRMLADLRKQESLQNADFQTPYRSDAAIRPLGDAPLLVTEVKLAVTDKGQLRLNFREQLGDAEPRGCQMDLATELVFGLLQLLGQALEQSQWQASAAPTPPATEDNLDPDMVAPRPNYLN